MPMNRRSFLEKSGLGTAGMISAEAGAAAKEQSRPSQFRDAGAGAARYSVQHCVAEWSYSSGKAYADPFNDVELDVIFTDPRGHDHRMPAFWAGGQTWKIRYSPLLAGTYRYRTLATDPSNSDLHGRSGILEVSEYRGDNDLLRHGPVRVSSDRRYFEHQDGTYFLWLGDTWWMGLCHRLPWPQGFQQLAADRVAKGFSVVQIVAGLYPDMPPFDPRGANEAGFPWEKDYSRINPGYFEMADLRIQDLVERGIAPCIVGCWGYFLTFMGLKRIKQHWRNIVARWGALPVFWCLAGEATMPYYLSSTKTEDFARQKAGWTEVARYVKSIDPYRHPITVHPSSTARDCVEDPSVLDFDMLQTGHGDRTSYANTINKVTGELPRKPRMPVLVGEVCYEGILDENRQEVSRFVYWACMLSGAAGHTYGADGIWQVNTAERPFGPSPHGRCWGGPPWNIAAQLPGSSQVALAKKLLSRYEWWRLEPHPEWVEPHWNKQNYQLAYAAGIPRELRLVFIPPQWDSPKIVRVERGVEYQASFFDPRTGTHSQIGLVDASAQGEWQIPLLPTFEQWVVILEKQA
ncbi:MAG TPA: DUF4038 domain-containing protein [Terriglobia bacterium]|nr:DUF4038 domain-containing protein [Terriglobia bacterium]